MPGHQPCQRRGRQNCAVDAGVECPHGPHRRPHPEHHTVDVDADGLPVLSQVEGADVPDQSMVMPAFRNATSTPPNSATQVSNAESTCSGSVTSQRNPIPPIDSATASVAGPSISSTHTRMPSAASRPAVARPIPDAPPVTSATRPESFTRSPPFDGLAVELQRTDVGGVGLVPLSLDESLDRALAQDGRVATDHPLDGAAA